MSEMSKRRITGILQHKIKSQEGQTVKLCKQYDRAKEQLSRYFSNLDSYKRFIDAQDKLNVPRFDTIEDYNKALSGGMIKEGEKYIIGPPDVELSQFIQSFWQTEIESVISRDKQPVFQLPAGSENTFVQGLKSEIPLKEQQEIIKKVSQQQQQAETSEHEL